MWEKHEKLKFKYTKESKEVIQEESTFIQNIDCQSKPAHNLKKNNVDKVSKTCTELALSEI